MTSEAALNKAGTKTNKNGCAVVEIIIHRRHFHNVPAVPVLVDVVITGVLVI